MTPTNRTFLLLAIMLSALAQGQANAAGQDEVSKVANSSVGTAGQRQTPAETVKGVEPLARIDTRIPNRVQSRIRNRIDRTYDTQANATSPFEVAGETIRKAGSPRRR